jgi:hypothetical protein
MGFTKSERRACRHRQVEHAQIDAELAAMLVPVVQHDIAKELRTRLGKHLAPVRNHAPRSLHGGIVALRKSRANGSDTFFERL